MRRHNFKDSDEDALFLKQYPGFQVTCLDCGSVRVAINNTLGYSPDSGNWGSIALECASCNHSVDIYES